MKSILKKIDSLQDLHEYICANHPEIANHVCERDDQLPTYTFENLKQEKENVKNYIESKQNGENYIPDYYGCGLICRCLAIAQKDGIEISGDFPNIIFY
jgi:hypothetical protein